MPGNTNWWVEFEEGPFSGVGVRLQPNSMVVTDLIADSIVSSGTFAGSSITMPFQASESNPAPSFGKIYVRNDNKPVFRNSAGTEYDLTADVQNLSDVLSQGANASGTAITGLSTQTFTEQATPSNPGAAKGTLFVKNTTPSSLAFVDDTGVETVLSTSSSQALTNKTLTDTSNNVAAKSLHSATTVVDVSAATAPVSGQVLTATSGTAATWQTPAATTLSAVLTSGNSAGSTSINMNSQNITSINQLSFAGDVIANGTTDKIQVGLSASAGTTNSIALGRKATTVTNPDGIAIGGNSSSGAGATASGYRSIAIGSNSGSANAPQSTASGTIAIGSANSGYAGPVASVQGAVAMGSASGAGVGAVVGASASAIASMALGTGANASGITSIAMGASAQATGSGTIAIGGHDTSTPSNRTVASGNYSVVVGHRASASTTNAIAIGRRSVSSTGVYALSIGSFAQATAANTISIGSGSASPYAANASATDAIAVGFRSVASSSSAIAIGRQSNATTTNSAIAIGSCISGGVGAFSTGSGSIAFGAGVSGKNAPTSSGTGSISIGSSSSGVNGPTASATYAICIGSSTSTVTSASASSAITVGSGSVCGFASSAVFGGSLTARMTEETVVRGMRVIRATTTSAVNGAVTLLTYPMLTSEISWFNAFITEREGDAIVTAWARRDYVFYRQSYGNVVVDAGSDINSLIVGTSTTTAAIAVSTTNVVVTVTKTSTASRTYFVTLMVTCAPLV